MTKQTILIFALLLIECSVKGHLITSQKRSTKQNKTKQNKTKQNKTKQNKTKTKTKQNKAKQNKPKTILDIAIESLFYENDTSRKSKT